MNNTIILGEMTQVCLDEGVACHFVQWPGHKR
jgi:hypothetical protein